MRSREDYTPTSGLRPFIGAGSSPALAAGVAIGAVLFILRAVTVRGEGKVTMKTPNARKGRPSVNLVAKVSLAFRGRVLSKKALTAVSAAVAGTA